jgi:hypothetical protein
MISLNFAVIPVGMLVAFCEAIKIVVIVVQMLVVVNVVDAIVSSRTFGLDEANCHRDKA